MSGSHIAMDDTVILPVPNHFSWFANFIVKVLVLLFKVNHSADYNDIEFLT